LPDGTQCPCQNLMAIGRAYHLRFRSFAGARGGVKAPPNCPSSTPTCSGNGDTPSIRLGLLTVIFREPSQVRADYVSGNPALANLLDPSPRRSPAACFARSRSLSACDLPLGSLARLCVGRDPPARRLHGRKVPATARRAPARASVPEEHADKEKKRFKKHWRHLLPRNRRLPRPKITTITRGIGGEAVGENLIDVCLRHAPPSLI